MYPSLTFFPITHIEQLTSQSILIHMYPFLLFLPVYYINILFVNISACIYKKCAVFEKHVHITITISQNQIVF